MADPSDFKRGEIVGAPIAGASETKTVELVVEARSTVSEVMTVFEKEGKTSLLKQNSERKRELSDRDRWTHTRIVRKNHKNTRWNDKIVALKKTTLQLYFKTFIEKINSGNLMML